jgi:hypothetical protein
LCQRNSGCVVDSLGRVGGSGKEVEEDAGPSLAITLLLTTGSRHPFTIDGKYPSSECSVEVSGAVFGSSVSIEGGVVGCASATAGVRGGCWSVAGDHAAIDNGVAAPVYDRWKISKEAISPATDQHPPRLPSRNRHRSAPLRSRAQSLALLSHSDDGSGKEVEEDAGPSLAITLLLTTGSRHPFTIKRVPRPRRQ